MAKAYRARKKDIAKYEMAVATTRAQRGEASSEQLALVAMQPRCAHCGRTIPAGTRADARYCSRACKAKAARARRVFRQADP
ncbi:hypothetical protein [Nonomuraea gerenzanensis]|uniref:Uncharacterized protein n=1 Tax=Nonomuraea gerenzanensis TaxID=93944 RepID=A0A1M4BKZ3_9ACTN|nr:hypothetical protein [Nonomuraea gerenzanensis]UBU19206.1 hypothetical protein LCN96_56145 [Nonomuraea gerenzanensis]SAP16345.1 hypothetical protein BN4615_P11008 [Nonomuraea gerenzanensis]